MMNITDERKHQIGEDESTRHYTTDRMRTMGSITPVVASWRSESAFLSPID